MKNDKWTTTSANDHTSLQDNQFSTAKIIVKQPSLTWSWPSQTTCRITSRNLSSIVADQVSSLPRDRSLPENSARHESGAGSTHSRQKQCCKLYWDKRKLTSYRNTNRARKNFSNTRQDGSKRKVLVAKVEVKLKCQLPNWQMQRNAPLVCFWSEYCWLIG